MPASQLSSGPANSLTSVAFGSQRSPRRAAAQNRPMASPRSFAFFATALGTCAIAWNEIGLTGVWLPEADAESLRRKMARRCDGARESAPSGQTSQAIEAITRLLAGERIDLSGIALDDAGIDDFDRRVYAVTRAIAPGRVLTYGEVAARVGAEASARAVGQSLGRNAMPIVVPCHRVVATGGGLGGFSAPGGTRTKRRMLAIEDAHPSGPPGLFDPDAHEPGDTDTATSGREARSHP
jgi:methylated-DNA-[protein]-cysteine S-methyltransferase